MLISLGYIWGVPGLLLAIPHYTFLYQDYSGTISSNPKTIAQSLSPEQTTKNLTKEKAWTTVLQGYQNPSLFECLVKLSFSKLGIFIGEDHYHNTSNPPGGGWQAAPYRNLLLPDCHLGAKNP